ncbi:ArsR/SmtB family transcription factor [Aestuariispira insulae]|uniref:ArsR family transcriptional regulator n=1 Tax=Aestuariispira insulae TaxID=1461337 RepID=A0A3D9HGD7_9PROT|nr:metalloregulator ArsR/SmtB family transcription factor [Aestuariispira insulae]RED48548.1 ArsR family transcriptional regulator [Aestuariispira insulae]
MEKNEILEALSALAQETRLDVFRLLVRAGDKGMLAGEIAQALECRQNTMSTHLAIMNRAGLVTNSREGRSIRYAADMEGMSALLTYLMEDCCDGRPELCSPVLNVLAMAKETEGAV